MKFSLLTNYAMRLAFIILMGFMAYLFVQVGLPWGGHQITTPYIGFIFGSVTATLVVILETRLRKVSTKILFLGSLGLLYGLILAQLISLSFPDAFHQDVTLRAILNLIFGYIGAVLAASQAKYVDFSKIQLLNPPVNELKKVKILDTSVLIDGRITDIIRTHFLMGKFIVPQFVLKELQMIADSHEDLKRKKGRRGLDVLNALQKMENITLEIIDMDFPEIPEVDLKLVELAKKMEGSLLTTDYNLNRVATVQNIDVLNINDLATALKPQILPGEKLRIFVHKQGKDREQGVGYLEDGTMVVVEDGVKAIGTTVNMEVTTVLQTSVGRIIFGRINP